MDSDDALPPPIRRLPNQPQTLDGLLRQLCELDDNYYSNHDDFPEDFAPPVRRQRSASVGSSPDVWSDAHSPSSSPSPPPLPKKSILRLQPEPLYPIPDPQARNFSHPFRLRPQLQPPRRKIPRVAAGLRRCSSLETIHSVTTTHSAQDVTPGDITPQEDNQYSDSEHLASEQLEAKNEVQIEPGEDLEYPVRVQRLHPAEAQQVRSQRYISFDEQQRATPPQNPRSTPEVYRPAGARPVPRRNLPHTDASENQDRAYRGSPVNGRGTPEYIRRPSESSIAHSTNTQSSTNSSLRSAATPPASITSSKPSSKPSSKSSASKVLRKLKGRSQEQPPRCEIEKRVSIDQQSTRTSSSGSASGQPLGIYLSPSSSTNTSRISQSSKDWKASNFDASHLTEADLKKCKKKGINPALYAEMKAARKGKLVSPIIGNTIL